MPPRRLFQRHLRGTATGVTLAVATGLAALFQGTPAVAQDATLKALSDRMGRLERQISDLERWSYREGKGPPPQQSGAAGAAPAASTGQLADAELRLSRLEAQVRELNGQIERIAHEVRTAGQRLDKLVGDVDFRLTEIERQLSQGASAPAAAGSPPADQAPPPTALLQGSTEPSVAPAASSAAQSVTLPAGTPMERYDFAYELLSKQKLQDAQQAFEQFLELHSDDKLAGNAQYWLGEIYYTNGDYQQAAKTFLESVQRYPDGNKAPDSMLKLAVSLRRLEQVQDACATLLELDRRFPQMETRIRRRVDRERQAAACP